MDTNEVRETIKEWVRMDDEERRLRAEAKGINTIKSQLSKKILEFMRNNEVDRFALEGDGSGTLSRSVRTSKPPVKRANIRKQLFVFFADQPQRVTEFLREMDSPPPPKDGAPFVPKQRECLMRTIPKSKKDA